MSVVSLIGVTVVNNPAKFLDKYQLEITFECLEPLTKDIEWKLTYVGSANSPDYDQELDTLLVGPIPSGVNKFLFEADPPNVSKIPPSEILGVTVVMLAGFYDNREFVRVGYYVSHEYDCVELQNEPPKLHQLDRITRNMLTEKPRVTRFAIKWDSEESAPPEFPPDQPEADEAEDDGELYGAEEAEFEAAVDAAALAAEGEQGEDVEMGGAEETTGAMAATGAGEKIDEGAESEDLEADSSGESDEEEEGEGEGDDDVEMGDHEMEDTEAAPSAPPASGAKPEL